MEAWSKVGRMPAAAIKSMQNALLTKMIRDELAVNSPYYRQLFETAGIDPGGIQGVEDLKNIPFTTKEDMLPTESDPYKARQFILQPPSEAAAEPVKKKRFGLFAKKCDQPDPSAYKMAQLFYSAGNSAEPVPFIYTRSDLDNLVEAGTRICDIVDLKREDTVLNAFSYAPHVSMWQMFHSTMAIGSTALHAGGGRVLGMEKIMLALNNMGAPVLAAHPWFALAALQSLQHASAEMPTLERMIIGMDFTPMAMVERIGQLMAQCTAGNNTVHRLYFLSEIKTGWAECMPGCGYHINPDHIFVEIIDPRTGDRLGEGERGELVVTNLDARGTVVLRFRTGDIATGGITTDPCPNCGRTVPRILGDIEQGHNFFTLHDGNTSTPFNGNALRAYMAAQEEVLTWYAEIVKEDARDLVKVYVKGGKGVDQEALNTRLKQDLSDKFSVPFQSASCSFGEAAQRIGLETGIAVKHLFDLRS